MASLRELTESDLDTVLQINNAGYPAVPQADSVEIRGLYHLSSYRRVAVTEDGAVVAFALAIDPGAQYDSENYVFFEGHFDNHLYLDRIVVADSARGLGLGTLLYQDLFEFARARGRAAVTCEVNLEPPNPGSLRFHRRFGFEDVATQATKGGSVVVQLLQAPLVEETSLQVAGGGPSVAIVIPAFNEEDTIRACVTAAVDQTVPADQIIVVDNKSTDQTPVILRELQEEFPDAPIIVLQQNEAQGITPARNMGFDAVTADIIGRIDSDSVLEPNWVEETKKVFLNENVHAATGPVIYYDMPLRRYMARADDSARRAISKLVKQYHFLFGTNMALRRTSWEAVRSEICLDADREMHEDIDLSVHLFDEGFNIVYAPTMVAGMSSRRADDSPSDFLTYVRRFDNTYNHHGLRQAVLRIPQWAYLGIYPVAKSLRWSMKLRDSLKR